MKIKFINPILGLTLVSPGFITIATSCSTSHDIVILFTNDTHTAFENSETGLGWSAIKGYRDWLESKGNETLLVDSGDFISGSMYAPLSLGRYNTTLMNACDIDLTIPGNHEFDFGKERFEQAVNELICPVISANLYNCKPFNPTTSSGEPEETDPVFEPSKMFNINGMKIGFVGVTTPQTTVATDTMSFKNEEGEYIYTFLGTQNDVPEKFYSHIQTAVNNLKQDGADIVIALTHLGIGDTPEYKKYGSENLISHTKGIDIVLDGHSHTYQPAKMVKNAEGKDVALTQTGTKFESIGELTIHKNKKFEIKLIDKIKQRSKKVDDILNKFKSQAEEVISKTVIDNLPFDMSINDELGKRIVRKKETTISEFVTDAFSNAVTNAAKQQGIISGDTIIPAIYNGGRIRESFNKGKITMGDVLNTTPFADDLVCRRVPGEILAQAFEYSISKKENLNAEAGAMLEVSDGFKAIYNISNPTPVKLDAYGCYKEMDSTIPQENWRLQELWYGNEQIFPLTDATRNEKYLVAGNRFILQNCGDGYNMFDNNQIEDVELDNVIGDAQAIADYFASKNLPKYKDLLNPTRIQINENQKI